ncbi:MAG: OsmC family protein [Pseudomonadota bacterium]
MARTVSIGTGSLRYDQNIVIGPHVLHSDEPAEVGGADSGPNAEELLLAALGACASITLQMYADRKQWPLHGVAATLSLVAGRIEMEIALQGDLSAEQREHLFAISQKCPLHRLLTAGVEIHTRERAAAANAAEKSP